MKRVLLSQRHPLLYFLAVWYRRTLRYFVWYIKPVKNAKKKNSTKLPYRVKKHQSVLIRKLGDSDLQLQYNKVENLKIAIKEISGMMIYPGEVFSFCKTVGLPTAHKDYLPGMELSFGEAKAGIGGGLCQIANLLHWLVLHSPLTIIEHHHHTFDPFPDDGRVLPFGSGATIFYNYVDYQFENNTNFTFQINLWLSEKCLEGELRISDELYYAYHVYEKNHKFLKIDNEYFRENEIWRDKIAKFRSGEILATELIKKNFASVKYVPEGFDVVK